MFNSSPKLLKIALGFFSGNTQQLLVPSLHVFWQSRDIVLSVGVCYQPFLTNGQSAVLDSLFWSSGLVQSSTYNITSQFILLCVMFMFCTSFLTTKKPNSHCYVSKKFSSLFFLIPSCLRHWWSFFPFLPACGTFLSNRYDESSSHPHLRAGRAHRASEGQRQPQALTGIWGEWAKGSEPEDSSACWFVSDCVFIVGRHNSLSFFPREMSAFPSFTSCPLLFVVMNETSVVHSLFYPLISFSTPFFLPNSQMQFPQIPC